MIQTTMKLQTFSHHQFSLVLVVLLFLTGCAGTSIEDPELTLPPTDFRVTKNHDVGDITQDQIPLMQINDPWESINRSIYAFNSEVDKYVLLPLITGYKAVLPVPVRSGIHNVISNLDEFHVLVNSVLQGRVESSLVTIHRFIINSTVGLAGIFDVASFCDGLQGQNADFGQTLGLWGFQDGPYIVLPLLGPSNVRDTFGRAGDIGLQLAEMNTVYGHFDVSDDNVVGLSEINIGLTSVAEATIRTLDLRAEIPFRYHSTGSPFEYELVRFLYTKKRELDVLYPHSIYDKREK